MNLIKLLALVHVAVALGHVAVALGQINSSYDFFYFIQTWPGSVIPPPKNVSVNFAIHGLWPMRNNGSYPKDCNASNPLDLTQISTLVTQLNEEWPSVSSRTSEDVWKREWSRHGTCSVDVFDQYNYFKRNLDPKGETKIFQHLINKGISPDGTNYSLPLIQMTLKDKVGVTPIISCNTNGSDPTPLLYEVYFCLDRSGKSLIECPYIRTRLNCGSGNGNITFPAYRSSAISLVNGADKFPLIRNIKGYMIKF